MQDSQPSFAGTVTQSFEMLNVTSLCAKMKKIQKGDVMGAAAYIMSELEHHLH